MANKTNFWWRVFITAIIQIFIIAVATGQTYEPLNGSGKGFDVSTGTKIVGSTITVDGHTFDVYTTKSGSKYIISNNGTKDYPVWIGEPGVGTYDNRPVRLTKKGTPMVLYCADGKKVVQKYLKVKSGS